jgi:hypothetical protein
MKLKYIFAKFSGSTHGDVAYLYIKPLFGKTEVYSHEGNPRFIPKIEIRWVNELDPFKFSVKDLDFNIWLSEKFNDHVILKTWSGRALGLHPWMFPPCPSKPPISKSEQNNEAPIQLEVGD